MPKRYSQGKPLLLGEIFKAYEHTESTGFHVSWLLLKLTKALKHGINYKPLYYEDHEGVLINILVTGINVYVNNCFVSVCVCVCVCVLFVNCNRLWALSLPCLLV